MLPKNLDPQLGVPKDYSLRLRAAFFGLASREFGSTASSKRLFSMFEGCLFWVGFPNTLDLQLGVPKDYSLCLEAAFFWGGFPRVEDFRKLAFFSKIGRGCPKMTPKKSQKNGFFLGIFRPEPRVDPNKISLNTDPFKRDSETSARGFKRLFFMFGGCLFLGWLPKSLDQQLGVAKDYSLCLEDAFVWGGFPRVWIHS